MKALERSKEIPGVRHVEPGAVVAHEENRFAVAFQRAELDARAGMLRSELPRVPEKIEQRHAQQRAIAPRAQAGRGRKLHRTLRLGSPKFVGHAEGHLA